MREKFKDTIVPGRDPACYHVKIQRHNRGHSVSIISIDCGLMANCRRLFISGIPVEASEEEIKKRFEVFGDVSSMQKIIRSQEGFPTKCFVYLDISLSDVSYHKCLSLYSKAKWKGNQLVIQPAKENFLNRLEAERQQKHREPLEDGALKKPNISYDNATELKVKSKDGKQLIKVKNSKKIKQFSSQSIMENRGSISDLTWDLTPTPGNTDMTANSLPAKMNDKDKTAKRKRSNKQRLNALEKSKDYNKPSIVEGAKVNSHIVFESEDKVKKSIMPNITEPPMQTPLLPLFGSDSEDNSDVEMSKPQFEGRQGAKLFKLQQKIGWDKRFEIDERFLDESNTSDGDTPTEQDDDEPVTSDEELRREQQRNRDLVEEMFGNTSSVVIPNTQMMPEVQRYDPSAIGSEALEKHPPPAKKKKVTLNEDVKAPSPPAIVSQEVHNPKVSKECFYSISDSLKSTLKTVEDGHIFNFTTSTPKDKNTTTATTTVASKKAPNWLLNLQNDGDDNETSESDEAASITELPSSDKHKRTLFFFHANSSELRNRLDCPDTKFHRTCSLEELEAKWPQTRARLKEQYKRRHRDALRWLRQRKQIK